MTEAATVAGRLQTLGEEIANSVSHGIGVLAALVATPFLIAAAVERGGTASIVGVSIFAVSMVTLYLTSTLYHAMPVGRVKQFLRILDHGAIFILIAGTYTPFTLGALRGTWGWSLFGLVWSLALIGIIMKVVYGTRYPKVSLAMYLAMGWLIVVAAKPLLLNVSPWGLFWLVAGGLAYTLGVVFYAADGKFRYSHLIWHLFVLAGTSCHFVAVMWYSS